jgi:hypothetical protein
MASLSEKSNGRAILGIRPTTVNRYLTAAVMLIGNKTPTGKIMRASSIVSTVLSVALVAGVAGCGKRDEAMGPAQKAGQAVDNAGDKVARDIQDKLDRANAAARQVADSASQTKDKIADATADAAADASKGLDKATEEVGKKVERAGEKIQEASKK